MSDPRLVVVEWEDASIVDEGIWVTRKDAAEVKPVIFQQVGWLLELTETHVVLSSAMNEELMSARDRIPLGMVRSIHCFDVSARKRIELPTPKPPARTRRTKSQL